MDALQPQEPSVQPTAPAAPAPHSSERVPAAAKPKTATPSIDLGSWQKKLSGFGSGFSPLSSRKAETAGQTIEEPTELLASLPDIGTLKMEWHLFLDSVSRADHSVLSVHLGSCEPVSCTDRGVFTVSCCRKFSYEELLPELPALQKSVAAFYRLPLTLRLVYDAEKDACSKEKTVFTLFDELSRKNPVVQFIIREFGGELIY